MIRRYKKTIFKLLTLALEANSNPYANAKKWHLLQKNIIKKRKEIEKKIINVKNENRELQSIRKNKDRKLSKQESLKVKEKIKVNEDKIADYRLVIHIISRIADIVPFSFIDKYDIKPQNFKEDAGFMVNKEGFSFENKVFNEVFKRGGIAIFNDITTVLKYGDITLLSPDKNPYIIECKSGSRLNSRGNRQKEKLNKLVSYLQTDIVDNLYGDGLEMRRIATTYKEKNYSNVLQLMFDKASKLGFYGMKVEKGLYYAVIDGIFDEDKFKDFFENEKITNPYMGFVDKFLYKADGYTPIALSIGNPECYWRLIEGKTIMLIIINLDEILNHAFNQRCTISLIEDEIYALNLQIEDEATVKISKYFFRRVFSEFISLDWLLKTCMNSILEKLKDKKCA